MARQSTVKYQAVQSALRERVLASSPGDRLPTESALCEEFGVSRITVRRAVEELLREGLVVRQQGRGTFVTEPSYPNVFTESFADRVTGFYRQQQAAGRSVRTRVLRNERTRDAVAAQALGLPDDAELIVLDRIRFVNGVLQQVSSTYLSATKYSFVLEHDFSDGSLYEFLEAHSGVVLMRNDLVVGLARADAATALALGVPIDEPVLSMTSTVYLSDDTPVAYGLTTFAPRSSEIAISLRDSVGSTGVQARVTETISGS